MRPSRASLFVEQYDILTRRHLTSSHCVAVRQMQWGNGIVGQQLSASFEGGARPIDVAGIEKGEGFVEGRLC